MNTVSAVLLKCGSGVEPEPIMVTGMESIQMIVGGNFETVRITAQDKDADDPFELVGYCNESASWLETNWLASALFRQEIRGNVVVVTVTDDGNDADVPDKMVKWLTTSFLERVASSYNEATMVAEAMAFAVAHNLIDEAELAEVMDSLGEDIDNGMQSEEVVAKMNAMLEKLQTVILNHTAEQEAGMLVSEIEDFLKTETEK